MGRETGRDGKRDGSGNGAGRKTGWVGKTGRGEKKKTGRKQVRKYEYQRHASQWETNTTRRQNWMRYRREKLSSRDASNFLMERLVLMIRKRRRARKIRNTRSTFTDWVGRKEGRGGRQVERKLGS
jgi:hypothetical protein